MIPRWFHNTEMCRQFLCFPVVWARWAGISSLLLFCSQNCLLFSVNLSALDKVLEWYLLIPHFGCCWHPSSPLCPQKALVVLMVSTQTFHILSGPSLPFHLYNSISLLLLANVQKREKNTDKWCRECSSWRAPQALKSQSSPAVPLLPDFRPEPAQTQIHVYQIFWEETKLIFYSALLVF